MELRGGRGWNGLGRRHGPGGHGGLGHVRILHCVFDPKGRVRCWCFRGVGPPAETRERIMLKQLKLRRFQALFLFFSTKVNVRWMTRLERPNPD